MGLGLFRQEAVAARTSSWAGTIVLAQPVPMRVATAAAATLTATLFLLLILGEYTRKVSVPGRIESSAGSIRVVAPMAGRVTVRQVADGQRVRAGQVMYELRAERSNGNDDMDGRIARLLAGRRREIERTRALQVEQFDARRKALEEKGRNMAAEIAQRRAALALQASLVEAARAKATRYATLARKGFISKAQLSDIRTELVAQQAKMRTLEAEILGIEREHDSIVDEAAARQSDAQLAASQAEQALAELEQERVEHAARSAQAVVAPLDGVVAALPAWPGQTVAAGQPLATLLPAGAALQAHLSVPSTAIGFVRAGQRVRIRLAAFPYQKFGQVNGVVAQVDLSPADDPAGKGSDLAYRVVVKLDRTAMFAYGKAQRFRPGMALEADIMQERKRLIEWIADPLVSAAQLRAGP